MTATAAAADTNGKAPEPVVFRSRRDVSLAAEALKHRADDLQKLAKRNDDEGYKREARTQRADAAAITDLILPAFREQGELPLVTAEQVRGGIAETLRGIIHGALSAPQDPKAPEDKQLDALRSREERILDALALRIETFASEVAELAYNTGYSARENETAMIVSRCIHALEA
jgi:hypothetical protein